MAEFLIAAAHWYHLEKCVSAKGTAASSQEKGVNPSSCFPVKQTCVYSCVSAVEELWVPKVAAKHMTHQKHMTNPFKKAGSS